MNIGPPIVINSSDPGLLFQAYCLNPPEDSCNYGPCPNPDVTGIGMQVSLYVTGTVVAVLVLYSPRDALSSMLAHLANIFALLLSALISLFKGQLTQNDAVFVLVATLSPITPCFWFWALYVVVRRKLPSLLRVGLSERRAKLLAVVVIVSFVLWLTILILISLPHTPLSQRACNRKFGLRVIAISLVWVFKYILSWLFYLFPLGLAWLTREGVVAGEGLAATDYNIVEWTRVNLRKIRPSLSRRQVAGILLLLQILAYQPQALIGYRIGLVIYIVMIVGSICWIFFYIRHNPMAKPSNFVAWFRMLWKYVMKPAPVMKFGYVIAIPVSSWINAAITANPTRSNFFTFGQILSLLLVITPLMTLTSLVWEKRTKIRKAIWSVEEREPYSAIPLLGRSSPIPASPRNTSPAPDVSVSPHNTSSAPDVSVSPHGKSPAPDVSVSPHDKGPAPDVSISLHDKGPGPNVSVSPHDKGPAPDVTAASSTQLKAMDAAIPLAAVDTRKTQFRSFSTDEGNRNRVRTSDAAGGYNNNSPLSRSWSSDF